MSDPQKKKKRRGTWAEVETIQDPDSNVALILSERIRGKPEYSMQLGHFDDMGFNKFIPLEPEGAKHPVEWIVKSLVDRAKEIVAQRTAESEKKD